jgi:ABC-type antimicrobial peptide transport system permease subunit
MDQMIRHSKILDFAIMSIFRRRLKNLSIVIVFTLLTAILSSILFFTHSFKMEAVGLLADAPELIVQRVSGGRHALIAEDYMEVIRGFYGVSDVIPRYWGYYFDRATDSNYTVMGINRAVSGLGLLRGRLPSQEGECALGSGVAEVKHLDIGKRLYLLDSRRRVRSYRVVGIFDTLSRLLTNDLILLTEDDIKELFDIPSGMATDIVVAVNNELEVPYIAGKIKTTLPDTRPIMRSEILQTYETLFGWRSGMMLSMFLSSLVAFSILAWDKATGLSAEERREIGILKAVGWETSDILELKFWEGLVISLTSFLTGTIIGYVHVFFLGAPLLSPVLKGWSVLFPSFDLIPYINPYQIITLFFLIVIPYIAVTIIPSWRAAIMDPDEVIRG